jgi:hypothetical protein
MKDFIALLLGFLARGKSVPEGEEGFYFRIVLVIVVAASIVIGLALYA